MEEDIELSESMNQVTIVPHPWRRFLARYMDINMYGIVCGAFASIVFRWNLSGDVFKALFLSYIGLFCMLLIEPLMLSTVGTTLGKGCFGLKVRQKNGDKLSYKDGFIRTLGVLESGMGLGIPFYNFYRNYKSYLVCKENLFNDWELDYSYEIKDKKAWRIIVFIGLFILAMGLNTIIYRATQLPINRGAITSEEYYENCNDFLKLNDIDLGYRLNESGEWVEDKNSVHEMVIILRPFPQHTVIEENGEVVEVVVSLDIEDEHNVSSYMVDLYMAYFAFVGAQEGEDTLNIINREFVSRLENNFEDFTFESGGVEVTYDVEMEGYQNVSNTYLIAEKDQEQHYSFEFRMKKIKD